MKKIKDCLEKVTDTGNFIGRFLRKIIKIPFVWIGIILIMMVFGGIYLLYGVLIGATSRDDFKSLGIGA
jgi:hypothetical protein